MVPSGCYADDILVFGVYLHGFSLYLVTCSIIDSQLVETTPVGMAPGTHSIYPLMTNSQIFRISAKSASISIVHRDISTANMVCPLNFDMLNSA